MLYIWAVEGAWRDVAPPGDNNPLGHPAVPRPRGKPRNPTPYTLHPTPYTLHPTLYTLHPTLWWMVTPGVIGEAHRHRGSEREWAHHPCQPDCLVPCRVPVSRV